MKTSTAAFFAMVLMFAWRSEGQIYETNNVVVQTFAGSGFYGYYDGHGVRTMFNNPSAIVADSSSNLFVWDSSNQLIRKITPSADVTTFAGNGFGHITPPGYGTNVYLPFTNITSMTMDQSNTIWFIGQSANGYASLITVGSDSYVTRYTNSVGSGGGVCFDSAHNLYFSDTTSNRIYRFTNGLASPSEVFAGSGNPGGADGNWIFTSFSAPTVLVADNADNIYVWDSGSNRIRRINQNRDVETIVGGNFANSDGTGLGVAGFNSVNGMLFDSGAFILACGQCIRKMTATTNVTTIAGNFYQWGYTNGPGSVAKFSGASGVCVSGGSIYVADENNQRIRQISFNQQPQGGTGAILGIGPFTGITISGDVGRTYQIQSSPDLSNWVAQATVFLTSSPYLWFDQNPVAGNKFYRALLLP